jgi:hypothetical protein
MVLELFLGKKGTTMWIFSAFKPSAGQLAAWNDDLSPETQET